MSSNKPPANKPSTVQLNSLDGNKPITMDVIFNQIIKNKIIKDSKLSSKIFFSFIIVGFIVKMIFSTFDSEYGTYGQASASLWGYTIILLSLISVVFLNIIFSVSKPNNSINLLKIIPLDMIIIVFYLFWLISINTKHFKKLNMNKIPPNYYIYSFFTTIVLALQIFFFIVNFMLKNDGLFNGNNGMNEANKQFINKINFINYLLIFINFTLIIIQQIILDNFSVDIL